jgi:hypothetical protein
MYNDAGGCGAANGGAGAETSGVGKKKLGIDIGVEGPALYVLACSGGRVAEVGGGDACHVCAVYGACCMG